MQATANKNTKERKINRDLLHENLELYSIMLPVLAMIFIFCYIPMYGIVIAFQKYVPGRPFLSFDGATKWVGLKYFTDFIHGKYFGRLMGNTIKLSLYNLVFGFPIPIIFALLLNEFTACAGASSSRRPATCPTSSRWSSWPAWWCPSWRPTAW